MRRFASVLLVLPLLLTACGGASRPTARPAVTAIASPDQYDASQPGNAAGAGSAVASAKTDHSAKSLSSSKTIGASASTAPRPTTPDRRPQSAGTVTVNASCRQPATHVGSGVAAKGQTPPPFTATTVDCKTLDFASFTAGRPTLVTFYASWCEGCQAEAKDIEAVYQEWHQRNGFVVIGIDTKDESGSPDIYYKHFHWTFASVWDDKEKILDSWLSDVSASALPVSYWIKPDGTVNDIAIGAESRSQMEQEVSAL